MKYKYFKALKNGEIDGLKTINVYKLVKEGELTSCFETYSSYGKNHIKLSMLPENEWIEINFEECCDILVEKGWGVVYNSSPTACSNQEEA